MNKLFIVMVVIASSLSFLGCAKYEEGSNFSLISAKNRLVNDWTMTKFEVNGVDQTANSAGLSISFYKDGTFKRTFTVFVAIQDEGTWVFADGKESVVLTKEDGSLEKYKIIQLKNKDFKAEGTDGSNINRYTFSGK